MLLFKVCREVVSGLCVNSLQISILRFNPFGCPHPTPSPLVYTNAPRFGHERAEAQGPGEAVEGDIGAVIASLVHGDACGAHTRNRARHPREGDGRVRDFAGNMVDLEGGNGDKSRMYGQACGMTYRKHTLPLFTDRDELVLGHARVGFPVEVAPSVKLTILRSRAPDAEHGAGLEERDDAGVEEEEVM